MTSNNFNFIAPAYDFLKWLIFRNRLDYASVYFFSLIPEHSKILIVGGGSGYLLEELNVVKKKYEIVFVEPSARLISRAQKRNMSEVNVKFINADILSLSKDDFDVVITPFVLDVFTKSELSEVIDHIDGLLSPNAYWFCTDFLKPKPKQFSYRILLFVMYRFFRFTTGMKNSVLYDYSGLIQEKGFRLAKHNFFSNNKVGSFLLKKP